MTGIKRKAANQTNRQETRTTGKTGGASIEIDMEGAGLTGDDMVVDEASSTGSEEEEWGGIDDQQTEGVSAYKSAHAQPTGKHSRPPTGQEIRAIKDAADLFQSSSFKLQIDALLPNVRPKESRLPPLERFLHALHSFLMTLPSIATLHPLEASRTYQKKGVMIPYPLPLPTEDTNWKVAFEKPSDVTLVGSWPNKLSVKNKDGIPFGVDLAVEMPDILFQEKDYLNGRFFHKRAFYVATIAEALKSSKQLSVDVCFDLLSEDPRLTKLVLVPMQDDPPSDFTKSRTCISIIPVLSTTSPIPLHRLSPSHSNIRAGSTNPDEKTVHAPTPRYNSALLLAFTTKSNLLLAHTLKNESPAFPDALALLRIWANQRGYGAGNKVSVRGFHNLGAFWTLLLAALILGEELVPGRDKQRRRSIGKGLSSYQLFRAALDLLAKRNFKNEPIFLRSANGHLFPPHDYLSTHDVICVDQTSKVNILANLLPGSLHMLQYDARKTLEVLDQLALSGDSFAEVFLHEHRDLPTRFDTVLRVDLTSANLSKLSLHDILDCGSPTNALLHVVDSRLRRGLGNRSKVIAILHPPCGQRPISQAHPHNPDVIYIGLIHDAQHAFRLVDHGPAAEEESQDIISEFRDLWGDKAELRRFKDGRITQSVVWDVKTVDERAHIPSMIVHHLLHHHLGIKSTAIQTWQASFDSVLRLPESISSLYLGRGFQTGFKGAITALDNLVKSIRALGDKLPLSLKTVSPVSECVRYTSVFSPVPVPKSLIQSLPNNARFHMPIEIVLEFERSARWPDDLRAIQKIKLAFFERIGSSLAESIEGLRASIVVGDGVSVSEITDQAFLEIITPEGWAFWARIWHSREIMLLDKIIENRSGVLPHVKMNTDERKKGKDYHDALHAKGLLTRRFIHGPRHHRAVASLAHRYPAYAGTVRLVKRWLASHWLLQGHVSEEAVEMICARCFVGAQHRADTMDGDEAADDRASVPASKERGFTITIEFLKNWAWEDGLQVPLYGPQLSDGVKNTASAEASEEYSGVWRIRTEIDPEGRMWTAGSPDIVAAHRVCAVSKATWEYLQGMEQGRFDVKAMLAHPTGDYDFLVNLDESLLPRYHHNVMADASLLSKRGRPTNSSDASENITTSPGLDPAKLLFNDLRRIYANTFKLFYDPFGGARFGGVWDPNLAQERPFRVLGDFSSAPATTSKADKGKEKCMVTLNRDSVLAEVARLGTGLITEVITST